MEIWGVTDEGAVRSENQDTFAVYVDKEKDTVVFAVCDGMGGARAGNVASGIATDCFMEYMRSNGTRAPGRAAASGLRRAVAEANSAVYLRSVSDPECAGMGTTLVAAAVTRDVCAVANIGDSRAYKITAESITQVTKDHSVVEDMIDRGDITRFEARRHPNRNLITRALGTSPDETPDMFEPELKDGDCLLLCTDGLSNVVEEREIFMLTARGGSARDMCERLLELALRRGAPDNVTAVLFKK
jgi:protein phosphatase